MNSLFYCLKKSQKFLAYPFIFLSSFLLVIDFISLFPIKAFQEIYSFSQNNLELFFGISAVFFVCYYTNNSKKAIASALAYALGDSVFYSLSNEHFSLLVCVMVAFFFAFVIKNLDLLYSYFLLLISSVIIGIILGACYDYWFSALKGFCNFMSNKEILFGAFNNFYSIFFSDSFGELFYQKLYSSSAIINDDLVVGVKNIFLADTKNPPHSVAVFMTGKYYTNIFITLGVFVALFSRFDREENIAFSSLALLSLIFGDIKLLSLFLFMFNPMMYLAYLAMIFVSYLASTLLDIRIGFVQNGNIIEFFKYGNRFVYFIFSGVIIAIMTYFLFQLVASKFDIQHQKLLPKEVRKIVNSLGGEKNILKVMDDKIIVNNPNLINVLNLDCDILENQVTFKYDELDLLKEYF